MMPKINKKSVKRAVRENGIMTLKNLAAQVPCSYPAIFFALEKPNRFPRVYSRIKELTGL